MGESVSAGAYVLGQEPSLTNLNPNPETLCAIFPSKIEKLPMCL